MIEFKIISNEGDWPYWCPKDKFVNFLVTDMGKFGDNYKDTLAAIDYCLKKNGACGGLLVIAHENTELLGGAVVAETMYRGFIPKHQLVYLCSSSKRRKTGVGKKILKFAVNYLGGDIALHVEKTNDKAINLYKKLGFKEKYLEMRILPSKL